MNFFLSLFLVFFSLEAFAEDKLFQKAVSLYGQGKYQATVEELDRLKKEVSSKNTKTLSFIAYWKGMSLNRLQEFDLAAIQFQSSLDFGYIPLDLHYELGQAYFALEKFYFAKIHFNESFKRDFKKGTCLYYLGYLSHELGDDQDAKAYYLLIRRLNDQDAGETRQAAELQISDIELAQAEKQPAVFNVIKDQVIPQYERALRVNETSNLAPKIKEKIINLQRKYELVLFQLRNGRAALIPPYFLRAAQEFGYDTNVTFTPTETTIASSKQGSGFSKSEVLGRYTFYYKNFFSIAPETRLNYTRYTNRIPEIFRNDNYFLAPAIRSAYEHTLFGNAASILLDYDFNYAQRDVQATETLDFSSSAHLFMLGERFKFFSVGETVVRLKERQFKSYIPLSNSKTLSLVVEQTVGLKNSTLLLYSGLDRTRVNREAFDSNALTMRVDWLLPSYRDWFNPSVAMGLTLTDPINDRSNRGMEKNISPGLKFSRALGKGFRLNSRLEHQRNISKDRKNFYYKRNIGGIELEYIF